MRRGVLWKIRGNQDFEGPRWGVALIALISTSIWIQPLSSCWAEGGIPYNGFRREISFGNPAASKVLPQRQKKASSRPPRGIDYDQVDREVGFDERYIPENMGADRFDWASKKYKECGQGCLYKKANENILLLQQYQQFKLLSVRQKLNLAPLDSQKLAIVKENYRICDQETDWRECLKYVDRTNALKLQKIQAALILNEDSADRLQTLELQKNPVIISYREAQRQDRLEFQRPDVVTFEELQKEFSDETKKLEHLSANWFEEWSKNLPTAPDRKDFIKYQLVPNPTKPGEDLVIVQKDENGSPVVDEPRYAAAVAAYDEARKEIADFNGRYLQGSEKAANLAHIRKADIEEPYNPNVQSKEGPRDIRDQRVVDRGGTTDEEFNAFVLGRSLIVQAANQQIAEDDARAAQKTISKESKDIAGIETQGEGRERKAKLSYLNGSSEEATGNEKVTRPQSKRTEYFIQSPLQRTDEVHLPEAYERVKNPGSLKMVIQTSPETQPNSPSSGGRTPTQSP